MGMLDSFQEWYQNNSSGAWKRVMLVYATQAAYLLSRAATADSMEALRYSNWTGRRTMLALKRVGMSLANAASISESVSHYSHYRALNELKKIREKQQERKKIIENKRDASANRYGEVELDGRTFRAYDERMQVVREAMILHYKGENIITRTVFDGMSEGSRGGADENFTTQHVVFIDLAPQISMQTKKNLVLTTVQGRDYTRKELVSGGDLVFSVSGNIVSNIPDMYPENDVKKLINIVEYGGIVEVNNMIFDQFNVNRLLIEDFRLERQDCKNVQPYSMTCVAVEPDTDVVVEADTIDLIDYKIKQNSPDRIVRVALNTALNFTGLDYSIADLIGDII